MSERCHAKAGVEIFNTIIIKEGLAGPAQPTLVVSH